MTSPEERYAQLCYNIFLKTSDGREWIEISKNKYIYECPTCVPGSPEGTGYFREGQNEFIRNTERLAKSFIENQNNKSGEIKK